MLSGLWYVHSQRNVLCTSFNISRIINWLITDYILYQALSHLDSSGPFCVLCVPTPHCFIVFLVAAYPLAVWVFFLFYHGLLIHEVSRSHTTTHQSQYHSSGRVTSMSQRPLIDNTQHSQQTDVFVPGVIRTYSLNRRAAADLSLRRAATCTGAVRVCHSLCTVTALRSRIKCIFPTPAYLFDTST